MKVYTKGGDKGQTSLIGGTRVPKNHIRIEAYGTVDELNSWLGVLRDHSTTEEQTTLLVIIQERLFAIGSHLANDAENSRMELPELFDTDIVFLEDAIDSMDANLPPMRHFILPGGHSTVSFCHVARCVCRRAERHVIHLSEEAEIDPLIIQYLNRLSDFLFVFSRKLSLDLNAIEVPWVPNPR